MESILDKTTRIYDWIDRLWRDETTQKTVSVFLVVIFLFALGIIEMARQGFITGKMADITTLSHYTAINLAFTLVLILEVISLIFAIPSSLSKALGKQFEILALIFLRNAFKELSYLPEPVTIAGHMETLQHIVTYGIGAVVIFALLSAYARLRKNLDETLKPGKYLNRFIAAKKGVALVIFCIFLIMGIYACVQVISGQPAFHFFLSFYTVLIFSDILLILIAQCFLPQFPAVFRNSGFALSTLLIRLSLTAPVYYNVIIGIASVLLALVLTLVYNYFYTQPIKEHN